MEVLRYWPHLVKLVAKHARLHISPTFFVARPPSIITNSRRAIGIVKSLRAILCYSSDFRARFLTSSGPAFQPPPSPAATNCWGQPEVRRHLTSLPVTRQINLNRKTVPGISCIQSSGGNHRQKRQKLRCTSTETSAWKR